MAGFLDSLKARCEVVELDGGRDWRGGVDGVELEDRVKWYINDQGGFESAWSQATEGKAGKDPQFEFYLRVPAEIQWHPSISEYTVVVCMYLLLPRAHAE